MAAGISAITISLRVSIADIGQPFSFKRARGPAPGKAFLVHRKNGGREEHPVSCTRSSLHVVVVHVGRDVGRDQHDRLVGRVLPPMRQVAFDRKVAGLMNDRNGASVRVFRDRAGDDINQSRAIIVAMPCDFPARRDFEPAHAQVMIRQRDLFLREIDLTKELFGDALVRSCAGLLAIACSQLYRPGIRQRSLR